MEYSTKEIANIIKVHPNTIRFYEDIGFVTPPLRKENGYRIYTDLQVNQCKFIKKAFKAELIQNGLRKQVVGIVELYASLKIDEAIKETFAYEKRLKEEKEKAMQAILITKDLLSKNEDKIILNLKRKEAADYLNVTVDTLRNWELNGLIKTKRLINSYRIYDYNDIKILKIIRTLRTANYSLSSILRLINNLNKDIDLEEVLNNKDKDNEIITACDHLIESIDNAISDVQEMKNILKK